METTATVTSKGQVTIPKAARDALHIQDGDRIVFRVEDGRAIVMKCADFISLAGSIPVPADKRNATWDEVLRRTRAARCGSAPQTEPDTDSRDVPNPHSRKRSRP